MNADLIALGLALFELSSAAIKAGKLVLQQIHEYAARKVDFSFESTLPGKAYASLLEHMRENGYKIHIFFLWIQSPELAIARIKERVREGGHDVSDKDVRRRFARGIYNFFDLYEPIADSWVLFGNSQSKTILIAKKNSGRSSLSNKYLFEAIQRE